MTQKVKMTIKLNKNIKEKLDKYEQYGYKKEEIITMGLILLEDKQNFEILLNNKKEDKQILKELKEIKKLLHKTNHKINNIKFKNNNEKLKNTIKQIEEDEIIPREQILHYKNMKPQQIGEEYFQKIENQTGIPKEIIKEELINTYTQTHLKDLNIEI